MRVKKKAHRLTQVKEVVKWLAAVVALMALAFFTSLTGYSSQRNIKENQARTTTATSEETTSTETTLDTTMTEATTSSEPLTTVSESVLVDTALSTEAVYHQTQATVTYVAYQPQAQQTANGLVLANGNSVGAIGAEAAAQMAAATGVDQSTWEYIIARESNGDPNASNASGASGLFQTMPGWGSTATVQDQINAAINAYNNQGLAAWGY